MIRFCKCYRACLGGVVFVPNLGEGAIASSSGGGGKNLYFSWLCSRDETERPVKVDDVLWSRNASAALGISKTTHHHHSEDDI